MPGCKIAVITFKTRSRLAAPPTSLTCYTSMSHLQDLQPIDSYIVVQLLDVEPSVIPLLPSGTVYLQNSHRTLIQWNSTHSNVTSRRSSSRNILICIRNAQSSASVCDSTCSTYDTLKTAYYYYYLLLLTTGTFGQ